MALMFCRRGPLDLAARLGVEVFAFRPISSMLLGIELLGESKRRRTRNMPTRWPEAGRRCKACACDEAQNHQALQQYSESVFHSALISDWIPRA